MALTREQIEAIRAGCDSVTDGPWATWLGTVVAVTHGSGRPIIAETADSFSVAQDNINAAHIARLDPDTVRALCDMALASLPKPEPEWIEHDGKGMPVDGKTLVDLWFRNGIECSAQFADDWAQWTWSPTVPDYDIIAYRIVQEPQP